MERSSETDLEKDRRLSEIEEWYRTEMSKCRLCPRNCRANRLQGKKGVCHMGAEPVIARAALHMWEEPCISGTRGSGAVFFTGCSLGCIFCQNREIAIGDLGKEISRDHLAEIFLEMEEEGAANLNLVTGEHFVPQIVYALEKARQQGLKIPVVYNSGGYEHVETLKRLEGYVDVYLPDLKYMDRALARAFSHAEDYPERAMEAIREMVHQQDHCVFGEDGYLKRGVIVRHLVLPGHTQNSKKVIRYLYETYQNQIYMSIMNQYTPVWHQETAEELNRKVTPREYQKVLDFALEIGVENGFFQEGETAKESFIPAFSDSLNL